MPMPVGYNQEQQQLFSKPLQVIRQAKIDNDLDCVKTVHQYLDDRDITQISKPCSDALEVFLMAYLKGKSLDRNKLASELEIQADTFNVNLRRYLVEYDKRSAGLNILVKFTNKYVFPKRAFKVSALDVDAFVIKESRNQLTEMNKVFCKNFFSLILDGITPTNNELRRIGYFKSNRGVVNHMVKCRFAFDAKNKEELLQKFMLFCMKGRPPC